MIREMEALFGEGFWDHLILGVSRWAYDHNSIMNRNHTGKTETWWTEDMNQQLREKFHINRTLEAVFIDSYAKQEWNLDDALQQEAFTRETTKLWNLYSNNSKFEFKTIQDIIDELNECKLENQCLTGEIQDELQRLATELDQTNNRVNEQEGNIQDNTDNIGLVSGRVTVNDGHIVQTNNRVDENKYNLNALETRVGNVEKKNEEQDLTISEFDIFPLGSIIPWVNKPSLGSVHQEDLPDGWVLCDGGVIPQGVWQGE